MVVVDTSVIIDHLRHSGKTSKLMQLAAQSAKEALALSVISVQELYEGQSTKDEEKEKYLLATISPLRILPYTYEVAQLAGEIARDNNQPRELADAAIAATVIINGATLFTLNRDDFVDVKGLELTTLNT